MYNEGGSTDGFVWVIPNARLISIIITIKFGFKEQSFVTGDNDYPAWGRIEK